MAMKDGSPFGIGWERWKDPTSRKWICTFTIITTDENELVAEIYDRMPLSIAPTDHERWLSDEPDPHDLMRPLSRRAASPESGVTNVTPPNSSPLLILK